MKIVNETKNFGLETGLKTERETDKRKRGIERERERERERREEKYRMVLKEGISCIIFIKK